MTSLKPALAGAHRLLGVVCALALLGPAPSGAAEILGGEALQPAVGRAGDGAFSDGSSPVVTIGPGDSGRARRIGSGSGACSGSSSRSWSPARRR